MIPPMNPNPLLGVLLVLGAATLWGTTGTARSLADGSLSAYWFGALRLATASAFFAVCAAASRPPTGAPSLGRPATRHVLGAGLCMAVYNLAFFAGIGKIGVALGTAIALGSGPIWAGLLQAALHRHTAVRGLVDGHPGRRGRRRADDARRRPAGGRRRCRRHPAVPAVGLVVCRLHAAQRTHGACRIGFDDHPRGLQRRRRGRVAGGVVDGQAPPPSRAPTWPRWPTPVSITAGLPYLLFSHALRHITPATGVTLALGEPVVAFALSVAVLGERPTALAYLGLLLVVCGVLGVVRQELASQRPVRRRQPDVVQSSA